MSSEFRTPASCSICDSNGQEYRFTHRGYGVFRCSQCGAEYLHPQPDDDVLDGIYDERYFLSEGAHLSSDAVDRLKRATARLYVEQIRCGNGGPGLTLLEIGCGTGDFLVEAQSRGMSVCGVEYSAPAAAAANRKLGAPVVQTGSMDTVTLPAQSFDVIAFSDVLEHVRKPRQFVTRAYSLLRPGGFAFAVTPSLDSWSRKLMGNRWMEYKVEHLFYFGRESLRCLFLSAGYERVTFYPNYKMLSVDYVDAHFKRFPVPVWTPLLAALVRVVPRWLAAKPVRVVASGTTVMAHKPVNVAV